MPPPAAQEGWSDYEAVHDFCQDPIAWGEGMARAQGEEVAEVADSDWQHLVVEPEKDVFHGPSELSTTVDAANAAIIESRDMIDELPEGKALKCGLAHAKKQAIHNCKTDAQPAGYLPFVAFIAQAGTRDLARYLLAIIPLHETLHLESPEHIEKIFAEFPREEGLDARYCDSPGVYKILSKLEDGKICSYTGQADRIALRECTQQHEEKYKKSREGKPLSAADAALHHPKTASALYITIARVVPRGVDQSQAHHYLARLWKRATGKDWRLRRATIVQLTCAVLQLAVGLHYGDYVDAVPAPAFGNSGNPFVIRRNNDTLELVAHTRRQAR